MKICLIPARSGSKRIKNKNIKNFFGKPLISYSISTALKSKIFDRVIVSTDHDQIADIAKSFGAEVPFKRPPAISEDVDTELVLQHAVNYLKEEENYEVDGVVLLQPTSPFRRAQTIKDSVDLFLDNPLADSVVTVTNVEGNRPEWMLSIDGGKVVPYNTPFKEDGMPVIKLAARQSFPTLYKQNGVVYVTKKDLLMDKNLVIGPNAYALAIDEGETIDIDTPTDFLVAEALMKQT